MKKCKKCHRQISIMEEYCSECIKNLSLREKLIEALRKEHFFKQGSTNRSLGNFSEYGLKGDFTSFNLPNAFSTSLSPVINRNKGECL